MADYKVGQEYWYGRTRCKIEAENLKGGGVNLDDALIQIRTANGSPVVLFYKTAHLYLSETRPSLFKKWPLTADS